MQVHGFIPGCLVLSFCNSKCSKYNSQCSAIQISVFKYKVTWSRSSMKYFCLLHNAGWCLTVHLVLTPTVHVLHIERVGE